MAAELWSRNLLKNPPDTRGDTSDWDNVVNVTVVTGGVNPEINKTFKFAPTASMDQTVGIPSQPRELLLGGFFLPGRDISSAAPVRVEIVVTEKYADASEDRYVVPGKTLIQGGGLL